MTTTVAKRQRAIDKIEDRPLAELTARELLNFLAEDGILLPDHAMGLFRDQLILVHDRLAALEGSDQVGLRGEIDGLKREIRAAKLTERQRPAEQLAEIARRVETIHETVRFLCDRAASQAEAAQAIASVVNDILGDMTDSARFEEAALKLRTAIEQLAG